MIHFFYFFFLFGPIKATENISHITRPTGRDSPPKSIKSSSKGLGEPQVSILEDRKMSNGASGWSQGAHHAPPLPPFAAWMLPDELVTEGEVWKWSS